MDGIITYCTCDIIFINEVNWQFQYILLFIVVSFMCYILSCLLTCYTQHSMYNLLWTNILYTTASHPVLTCGYIVHP